MDPRAPPFPQPNSECGATSKVITTDSTSVLESVVANLNLTAMGASLPPLEVIEFSGDPCEFFKFKTRFHHMVESQNLSDAQKMSRLLQFLEGNAKRAVAGFETSPPLAQRCVRLCCPPLPKPRSSQSNC